MACYANPGGRYSVNPFTAEDDLRQFFKLYASMLKKVAVITMITKLTATAPILVLKNQNISNIKEVTAILKGGDISFQRCIILGSFSKSHCKISSTKLNIFIQC